MGFNLKTFISNPVKQVGKVLHNPESALLNKGTRQSKAWKQYGRPATKIAADVGLAYLTGGGSLAAAGAGGLYGLAADTNSSAFTPVNNIVMPAAIGYAVGNSSFGKGFDNSMKAGLTPSESLQVGLNASGGGMATIGNAMQGLGMIGTGASLLGGSQQQQQQGQYSGGVAPIAGLAPSSSSALTGGAQNQMQARQLYTGQPQNGLSQQQINGVNPQGV